jgi:hypothetical protein
LHFPLKRFFVAVTKINKKAHYRKYPAIYLGAKGEKQVILSFMQSVRDEVVYTFP